VAGKLLPLKDLREQLEAVRQQPDNLEGIQRSWADTVTQFRGGFEAPLGTYASDLAQADPHLKVEEVRFAILVDDLDRCAPETILATLDAIRHFLSTRRDIFVLALNSWIVTRAAARKLDVTTDDGREYLEGILQSTFHQPEPAPEQVRQFARQQLERLVGDPDPALKTLLDQAFDDFGQTLEECRIANPRKIKCILNWFLRFLDRYTAQLEQFSMPNIVRLLALAEMEPGLFQAYLADAERVSVELMNVGTPDFSIRAFEEAHDVSVRASYPRLLAMSKLFQLAADKNKPGLRQQVEAVDAMTRWE
jgi:hypothetical protein